MIFAGYQQYPGRQQERLCRRVFLKLIFKTMVFCDLKIKYGLTNGELTLSGESRLDREGKRA